MNNWKPHPYRTCQIRPKIRDISAEAASFASNAHESQKRKYTGEPYFVHCAEVAEIVRSVGGDSEMIAAAYLHDTVEDTSVEIEDIEREFGKDVADLVADLTDVSTPFDGSRAERKALDREHSAKASSRAKTIKLADLISNSKSITKYDPGFAVTYMREKQLLLPHLVQGNNNLFKEAERIIQEYYDSI